MTDHKKPWERLKRELRWMPGLNRHIEVVPDEAVEPGSYWVCMRDEDQTTDPFAEDRIHGPSIRGSCSRCQQAIHWRPYAPNHTVKVCVPCAMELMAKEDKEAKE